MDFGLNGYWSVIYNKKLIGLMVINVCNIEIVILIKIIKIESIY